MSKEYFQSWYKTARSNYLFLLLMAVFVGTSLMHMSFVPMWDGMAYMRAYMQAALTGNFVCCEHSAYWHSFLFSLTQLIDLGNCRLVYLLNILLGIWGLTVFYLLLEHLFRPRLSNNDRALITFLFGLNPIFLAHVIQPSTDYPLPIYITILLYALLKERFIAAAILGMMLVFTKESGFVIYGLAVILYSLFFGFQSAKIIGMKKKVLNLFALSLPVILFLFYMKFNKPHFNMGPSWTEVVKTIFKPELLGRISRMQLADLFLINFYWIPAFFIVLAVFLQMGRLSKEGLFRVPKNNIYICSMTVLVLFFLTRFEFANNPRYILPALPLFILVFTQAAVVLLEARTLRVAILSIILALVYLSSFRTFDPVAKKIFGTFKFGSHDILFMQQDRWGRDQIVYNYEFTRISDLTCKIINQIGAQNIFVVPRRSWNYYFYSIKLKNGRIQIPTDGVSIKMGHRTLLQKDGGDVKIYNSIDVLKERYKNLYYIVYPTTKKAVNNNALNGLLRSYVLKETINIEEDGYAIAVLHLIRKEDNNPSQLNYCPI